MRLFGTDGIRGIANTELTAELALSVGRALGRLIQRKGSPHRVLIGEDTRLSSGMLSSALASGLLAAGCDVINVGVAPTPAVAYLTRLCGAGAGVVISASHNPYEYNGIKIFGKEGFKLPDKEEDLIEEWVRSGDVFSCGGGQIGRILDTGPKISDYIDYICSIGRDCLSGMRIGVDMANGATCATALSALRRMGAECVPLGDSPNGKNVNDNCGSTHIGALSALVKERGLDAGVAFDGDGDRLIAVDERGETVDGDAALGILAPIMKESGGLKKNTVVGTVMTNPGLTCYLEEKDIRLLSTKVGDRHVLELMESEGYSLGGESSGHIIFRELATTGDGLLTATLLLGVAHSSGKRLSELSSAVPHLPQLTVNVAAGNADKRSFSADRGIAEIIKAAEDKLGGRGKILARVSGTEPCIRITVSAETEEMTERICRELSSAIDARLAQAKAP